jgi:hypothetical protein
MDLRITRAFVDELEKQAVSAARTLALLRARTTQGARVAPGLMQHAQQAAATGATTTAPSMRRLALGAGQDARAVTRAQAFGANPITQDARQRTQAAYNRAMDNPAAVRVQGGHLAHATDHGATGMSGATSPYTRSHANRMFASRSQVIDPRGVGARVTPRAPALQQNTPPMGQSVIGMERTQALPSATGGFGVSSIPGGGYGQAAGQTSGTVVRKRPRAAA